MPSTRWRWPESWLEGIALPVLLGTLRIAWIWPWLLFLGRWMTPAAPRPWLPLWSLFVLLLGGRIVAHLAQARCRTLRAARLWVALSGLGVILVVLWWQYGRAAGTPGDVGSLQEVVRQLTGWTGTVPAAVWALFVASALWLRGVLDGRAPPGQAQIRGAFLTGCGAFVLLLLAGAVVPAALPPGVQGWLVLFVVAGMAALALSSLEQSSWAGYGAAVAARTHESILAGERRLGDSRRAGARPGCGGRARTGRRGGLVRLDRGGVGFRRDGAGLCPFRLCVRSIPRVDAAAGVAAQPHGRVQAAAAAKHVAPGAAVGVGRVAGDVAAACLSGAAAALAGGRSRVGPRRLHLRVGPSAPPGVERTKRWRRRAN